MRIEEIHPWQLPRVWHILRPIIDKALDHSLGERMASDMLQDFMNDNLWLLTAIDDEGDLKMSDFSGVIAFAEMLKSNSTLTDVKYAATQPFPCCQHPLTRPPFDS